MVTRPISACDCKRWRCDLLGSRMASRFDLQVVHAGWFGAGDVSRSDEGSGWRACRIVICTLKHGVALDRLVR